MKLCCYSLCLLVSVAAYIQDSGLHRLTYSGYRVFRVQLRSSSDVEELRNFTQSTNESDIWHIEHSVKTPHVDLVIGSGALDLFRNLVSRNRLQTTTLIADLGVLISYPKKREPIPTKDRLGNRKQKRSHAIDSAFDLKTYNTYDDIASWLTELPSKSHSNLVSVDEIGKSYENRTISRVKIGKPRNFVKPSIWIDAGIHSREWISISTALYMINEIIARHNANDSRIHYLLNWVDFHIAPLVNPDGYEHSRKANRLWRKTRSKHAITTNKDQATCIGVDANRNFNYYWGTVTEQEDGWCSDGYPGPSPMSEPETRALADAIKALQPNLVAFLTLHSYGQMWLAPWGYSAHKPKNYQRQRDMALVAIDSLQDLHKTPYSFGTVSDLLYPASGTSVDYAHSLNVTYSYAVELRPGESTGAQFRGFIVSEEEIVPTGQETLSAILAMLEEILLETPLFK